MENRNIAGPQEATATSPAKHYACHPVLHVRVGPGRKRRGSGARWRFGEPRSPTAQPRHRAPGAEPDARGAGGKPACLRVYRAWPLASAPVARRTRDLVAVFAGGPDDKGHLFAYISPTKKGAESSFARTRHRVRREARGGAG